MSTDWPDFNDLWDYNQPAATEKLFRRMLADGPESGDYPLQLKTQIGRTLGLQRRFEEAHALLDEVARQMAGSDVVEVRYLLERGRVFNSSGKPQEAVPLFKRAFEIAKRIAADFYAVDALHMLGIAGKTAAERMDCNLKAIDYAKLSNQEKANNWLGTLYNNTAWGLFEVERYEEALNLFQQALTLQEARGDAWLIGIARWSVAKTLRVLGRVEEALAILWDLEAEGKEDGFTEEEIGECLLVMGDREAARPYFKMAYDLLSQIDWVAEDTARMERLNSLAGS